MVVDLEVFVAVIPFSVLRLLAGNLADQKDDVFTLRCNKSH